MPEGVTLAALLIIDFSGSMTLLLDIRGGLAAAAGGLREGLATGSGIGFGIGFYPRWMTE